MGVVSDQDGLLEAASTLLWRSGLLTIAVAREGRIQGTSGAFAEMFGLEPTTATGVAVTSLVADADRARIASALLELERDARAGTSRVGSPMGFAGLRPDGSSFDAEWTPLVGSVGPEAALVLVAADVSARRRAEQQLSYLAYLDALTGLPNRALLLDRLRDTLAAARRDRRCFAVLMCDLDGFKQVNDTYGHDAGDALLQAVSQRLQACVRDSDTVARLGGDEFAVLLPRVAREDDAAIVAARMVRSLEAPVEVGAARCQVGISIGIATYPHAGDDLDGLVAAADAAMYASKRSGKNRYTGGAATPAHVVRMPFLRWADAHDVGLEVIDVQHRAIVDLINQLGDDLKAGRDRDAILRSLRALVSFTRKHFAMEESLMARCPGWSLQAAHVDEHHHLLDDLVSLSLDVDVKSMTLTMRFLQEWLLRHIDVMDKPLAAWLARDPRGGRPSACAAPAAPDRTAPG